MDHDIEDELKRAHEWKMCIRITRTIVTVIFIVTLGATATCVHQDYRKAQVDKGTWSTR